MNKIVYSIWLQQCVGYAFGRIKDVISTFGSAQKVYEAPKHARIRSGLFTPKQLNRFSSYTLDEASDIMNKCEKYNYSVLTIEDPYYPQRLYEISNPPCVLYISGKMPDIDNTLTIGIVGTRTATSEGIRTSFTFGRDLSRCGAVVVSGGALGIDCASHRGALQSDGVTVCVLGCGINYDYLSENAQMRKLITRRGAVISEYPPDTPPANYNFPARNRIISGLSNGLLVIEAGARSGSLITASLALEQNRDVFATPGSIINSKAQGTNSLLKSGAIMVTSYKDIVSEYVQMYNLYIEHESMMAEEDDVKSVPVAGKRYIAEGHDSANRPGVRIKNTDKNKPDGHSECPDDVSDDAKLVYSVLSSQPIFIDQISDKLELSVHQVMSALTELEILDVARNVSGGRYIRN